MHYFKTLGGVAGAAVLLAAQPALGQDAVEKPFDGVYVGGSIGYSVQNNDVGEGVQFDRDLNGTFGDTVVNTGGANVFGLRTTGAFDGGFCNGIANGNNLAAGCANDEDDVEYYGRLGYDKQFRHLVVGALVEFGTSNVRDSVTAFTTTPAAYQFTRKLDWNVSLRGRLGYAVKKTLFYGTGGATYGKIDNSFFTTNAVNAFDGRGSDNSWGFQVGGGLEQKIGKKFSIGVEYLYTRFTEDDYLVRASRGTAAANHPFVLGNAMGTDFQRTDSNFDFHSLRATIAYRF